MTMQIDKSVWNLVVDLLSFSNNKLIICTSIDGGKTRNDMKLIIGDVILEGRYTIHELIDYLRLNFKDPNIKVRILSDDTPYPINIVGKNNGNCVFINYP